MCFLQKKCDYCLDPAKLKKYFTPLLKFYNVSGELIKNKHGRSIIDVGNKLDMKLNAHWKIFSNFYNGQIILDEIYRNEVGGNKENEKDCQYLKLKGKAVEFNRDVEVENLDYSLVMYSEWNDFKKEIVEKNRFFPTGAFHVDMLKDIFSFLVYEIEKEAIYFRARIGIHKKKKEIKKPHPALAKTGRVNPIGISYLYLAFTEETAIKEIRPFPKCKITMGYFRATKKIKVIDLRLENKSSPFVFGTEVDKYMKCKAFIGAICREMGRIVNLQNTELDYLPLQYICELIKVCGYRGVIYDSFVGKDCNLAIFNGNEMQCAEIRHYVIEDVEQKYEINRTLIVK